MDLFLSVVTSGAVSAIVVFMSKEIAVQLFKKNVERFKVDLQTDHKLNVERKIHSYKEERKILNELWLLIVDLVANYGALCPEKSDIDDSIDKLEMFVDCNEVYIQDKLLEKINSLVKKVDVETSKEDKINEIQELRKEIVQLIKGRVLS